MFLFKLSQTKQISFLVLVLVMKCVCSCRCWRFTCGLPPRCTGEFPVRSLGAGSTRTCCSIPASNTCTSPRRKRSSLRAFHSSGRRRNEPLIYSLRVIWSFIQATSTNTSICITAHNHSSISSLRSSAGPLPPCPLSFHLPPRRGETDVIDLRNEIITDALQEKWFALIKWSFGAGGSFQPPV